MKVAVYDDDVIALMDGAEVAVDHDGENASY